MAEPLKNLFSTTMIGDLSSTIKKVYPEFESRAFKLKIFDAQWDNRELKERMYHISQTLRDFLPGDFHDTAEIIEMSAAAFTGFQFMFFPDFIERYGLDHYDRSIEALGSLTQYSSSEFAVRPFIIRYPNKMMKQMRLWSESSNHHLRRLSTEGCRPRLPWAIALPEFKKDPSPILPILEILKGDESEYVRRSVANNLNDISKDNPEIVIAIAKRWFGKHHDTDRLVKHACRTMLKQGVPDIMELFGFHCPDHIRVNHFTLQESVKMGDRLEFAFDLFTDLDQLGKLRIEYAIDFVRKYNSKSKKVFSISESTVTVPRKSVSKSHSFKAITTRKYYPGEHGLSVLVNGHEIARGRFELK